MSLLDAARHRLRSLLRPDAAARERDEEFAFHQSLAEQEHLHATGNAADAPYAARREFGNATLIREEVRWTGAMRWVDQFGQDLRFAARTLRRSPVFATVAILSIGLGIGANTAVFGVLNELFFKSLPAPHPEELAHVWRNDGRGGREPIFNVPEYEALRSALGVEIAAIAWASALEAEIAGTSYTRLQLDAVDGGLFPMLAIGAAAGRLIGPEDDRTRAPVAVLGYASAVSYFGSAAHAVGRQITLQRQPFTIIGVLPREWRGLHVGETWTIVVPRTTALSLLGNDWSAEAGMDLIVITRVAGPADHRRMALDRAFAGCCANGQLVTPGRGTRNPIQMRGQHLNYDDISRGINADKFDLRVMFGRLLYTLFAGVAIVLLMACTNVGSLLLARATVRSRELAVRMSLGASRGRVVRQLLAESVLLATAGSILGLAIAFWGTALIAEVLPGQLSMLRPFASITPDVTLIGFTAGVAVLCTIVFGVLPAFRATHFDPVVGLRAGAPGSTRSGRLDRGIIAFQMALALVLIASAGLLAATVRNLQSGLGGMDSGRLLVAAVETRGTSIPKGGEEAVYDDIFAALRSVPGVVAVAGSDVMPLLYMGYTTSTLNIAGFEDMYRDVPVDFSPLAAGIIKVTPGFFATTSSGLIAGREFTDDDAAGSPKVVVISESLARQFFAGRDPIGQMIGFGRRARDMQVIGVARAVKQTNLRKQNPNTVYMPRAQRFGPQMDSELNFAIRTAGDAADVVNAARAAIVRTSPEINIRQVQPLSEIVARSLARERALGMVAVLFSVVAVGLAAIGLYGVLAFQVASRSREIGIRMALGANASSVVRLVIRQSLVVVAAGIIAGVPLALAASTGLRALLYGIEPFAPLPLAIAAVVLVATGLVAALLPSRNAAGIDPLLAIRSE